MENFFESLLEIHDVLYEQLMLPSTFDEKSTVVKDYTKTCTEILEVIHNDNRARPSLPRKEIENAHKQFATMFRGGKVKVADYLGFLDVIKQLDAIE